MWQPAPLLLLPWLKWFQQNLAVWIWIYLYRLQSWKFTAKRAAPWTAPIYPFFTQVITHFTIRDINIFVLMFLSICRHSYLRFWEEMPLVLNQGDCGWRSSSSKPNVELHMNVMHISHVWSLKVTNIIFPSQNVQEKERCMSGKMSGKCTDR